MNWNFRIRLQLTLQLIQSFCVSHDNKKCHPLFFLFVRPGLLCILEQVKKLNEEKILKRNFFHFAASCRFQINLGKKELKLRSRVKIDQTRIRSPKKNFIWIRTNCNPQPKKYAKKRIRIP